MAAQDPTTSKKCRKCQVTKPCDQFYRDRTRLDGCAVNCKECHFEAYPYARPKKAAEPGLHVLELPGVTFKDIDGFPGYRVGDDGSVWSQKLNSGDSRGPWRRLGAWLHGVVIGLRITRSDGVVRYVQVGRLVLEAFVGSCPEGMECCHAPDHDPWNCRLDNLRWDTHEANLKDRDAQGRTAKGVRIHGAKLDDDKVRQIFDLRETGMLHKHIAEIVGIDSINVCRVLTGKYWSHVRRKPCP